MPARKSTKKRSTKKTAKKATGKMTKSGLFAEIAESMDLKKSVVKGMFENLSTISTRELKKNQMFILPGFAKFVVKNKPARKARKGINPFTREECIFKAKPASKAVRARPVSALKKAVA